MILIRNGAVALDLILDLVDLVLLYEKRICSYMRNILFLKYQFACCQRHKHFTAVNRSHGLTSAERSREMCD